MATGAIQLVRAVFPVSIISNVLASILSLVEEHVGWSSEVLLSVSKVAVTPFMLLVDQRTETGFIAE